MKPVRLRRRALLRGLGGTAIALPFLEAMLPKARAMAQPAQRYVVTFMPFSLLLFVCGVLFGYFVMMPLAIVDADVFFVQIGFE